MNEDHHLHISGIADGILKYDMKKKGVLWIMFLGVIGLLSSCGSSKNTIYFQDMDKDTPVVEPVLEGYNVKIHKDDLLAIMVNSVNPELALPFNMPMVSYQVGSQNPPQQRVLGYLVDKEGTIDFPILGVIHVEGLTREELVNTIKDRLIKEDYIRDPIVTVQFLNFKVSVVGEVARPGTFTISGDRVTLLEALSLAGDLTIYGRRDRVMVIRESGGERAIRYLDLRNRELFDTPYYYLQQNDIIYVEPNKRRAQQSDINQNNSMGVWLSAASLLTTVAVLIFK